ncbi:ribonuclease P protein subunit p14-like [Ixodes scapularis]
MPCTILVCAPVFESTKCSMWLTVGASIQVDVLRYREHDRRAYLRTSIKNLVKVWSSLTLCTSYDGKPCTFRIFKVSCSLASLSVCSSHYEHKPVRQTTDID